MISWLSCDCHVILRLTCSVKLLQKGSWSWSLQTYFLVLITSANPFLEQLNWKQLDTQRQIQVATMVYKSIHGLAPDYLGSLFTKYNPPYNLRNSENKLAVPLPRTNFLKNSFSYNGAVIWNSLSPELRQAKSLKSFRNGCRDFFDWIDKTHTASM